MALYTLMFKNRTYEIPKYSIAVRKKMDRIDADNMNQNIDQEQKYRNMYEFIKEMVGEENAVDMYGTNDFDQVDLNDITISYLGVCSAYDKPVNDERKKSSAMNSVSEEDKKLITEIIRNAGSLQNLSNSLGTNPQNQNLRVLR